MKLMKLNKKSMTKLGIILLVPALLILLVIFMRGAVAPGVQTTIQLNSSYDLIDRAYQNINSANIGSQIKWDIRSVPAGATIDDGTLCLYIYNLKGVPDNDIRLWRIANESWLSGIVAEQLQAMPKVNETNKTLSSTTSQVYTCFNVTLQLQESYANGEKNFTIRFEDPDYLVSLIDFGLSSNLKIGTDLAEFNVLYGFNDTSKPPSTPYLNITYTTQSSTPLSSDPQTADDWPMFHRDLNHSGYTTANSPANISNVVVNKFVNTSARAIKSSPIIANGSVYVGTSDVYVYQLNATNISLQIANFSTALGVNSSLAIAGDYAYVGSGGGMIYQLNISNISQQIASYIVLNVQSSPAVFNNSVYIGNSVSLLQLNASNASQMIAQYVGGGIGFSSSPAISNRYAYIGTVDYNLEQVNVSNVTQFVANYATNNQVLSSPAITNNYVYLGTNDNAIYQFNSTNVSILVANFSTGGAVKSSPAVANSYVYVGSQDNQVYQLNATNVSQLIASYTTGGDVDSSPAVTSNYVYVGSSDAYLYQLNATNISKLIGRYQTGGAITSSPAISNGSVYVGSNDGYLYQFTSTPAGGSSDTTAPVINLGSPANNTKTTSSTIWFSANFTDDINLLNATLYLWNSTLAVINNTENRSISGTANFSNISIVLPYQGVFYWNYYACDNSSNCAFNITNYTLTYDATPPYFTYLANVSIQTNDSVNIDYNATDTIAFENFSVNDTRFSINASGWFKNSSGLSIGVIFVNITINDTSNNKNSSVVFVNISAISSDTTFPIINIAYPTNISYSINVSALNYSITELNKDRCWYGNSTANFTDVAAGVNFTSVQSNEGSNTWTVYCNDTANNLNSTSVTFTKDTTVPAITILLPANTSYASTTSTFNVTLNENGTDCLYSLDGAGNITMTNKNNSDFGAINSTMAQGSHNVIYSCNDTSNNRNASVTRYFSTDSVFPLLSIAYPTNISYSINVSALNYSITELNKDRCWYGNSTANFTDVAAGVNFTSVQSNEGSNTWTVYCNDTANNLNSTSVTFTKDTTVPAITILLPANTSYASTTSTFNVTLNENGTDCLYSLDGAG